MSTRALYAGSFDPITLGHVDIIRRSASMFGHVVVAIGHNPKKPGLFTPDERVDLIRQSCKSIKNISVTSFSGLTSEFARREKCSILLRGLRDAQDFGFEMQMANMNYHLESGVNTVFIPCLQQYSSISSSLVKEIATCLVQSGGKNPDKAADQIADKLGGLVPPAVVKAFIKRNRQ
jgi:pantetheine-phosphate adenylyltransferase